MRIHKFKLVRPSIYEFKDVKRREKWENFFKMVEDKIPPDVKIDDEEILEALPKKKVNDVLNRIFDEVKLNLANRRKQYKSNDDDIDINDEKWDLKVHPESRIRAPNENQSMYLKFLRSSEKKAAVWRPAEVCTSDKINDLTLSKRGEIVTNMIAKDFCDWLRNLGGLETTAMDEDILKELFQIGLENPAARSICVEMIEKPAVSHHVADSVELPKKAFHRGLHRQLLWDLDAEKSKRHHKAFGTWLSERWEPPANNTWKTWIECGTVPEELVTFSTVFAGIAHLKSVKEYYSWLMNNPQFKIPKYLQERRCTIMEGQNIDGNTSR